MYSNYTFISISFIIYILLYIYIYIIFIIKQSYIISLFGNGRPWISKSPLDPVAPDQTSCLHRRSVATWASLQPVPFGPP